MTDHLPPRDRRQRKRFLTRKNLIVTAVVALGLFSAVSLWNELNPKSDDALALVRDRAVSQPVEVVREAEPYQKTRELPSSDASDTLWVERPRKEEILGVDPYDQYQRDDRYTRIETTDGQFEDAEPAISFRGGDEPFLGQRSDRSSSRVKISGTGSSLTLETPADDEG